MCVIKRVPWYRGVEVESEKIATVLTNSHFSSPFSPHIPPPSHMHFHTPAPSDIPHTGHSHPRWHLAKELTKVLTILALALCILIWGINAATAPLVARFGAASVATLCTSVLGALFLMTRRRGAATGRVCSY